MAQWGCSRGRFRSTWGSEVVSLLRMIYLGLTFWGAAHPSFYMLRWADQNGWDIARLPDAWAISDATRGLMWDLAIVAAALVVFIVAEVATRRNWDALIAIPATIFIGPGCGLPLYLFMRSRPVR